MELEIGRPKDESARLEREIKVYDLLDELNIGYMRIDHAPADTMEVCKEIDESLGCMICKNLFLCNRQQTDFYLLMMPDDKVFKTKDLSPQLGTSRLSFASGEQMEEMLGTTPGSASVMGLMNDTKRKVHLVIDKDVIKDEYIGCHPCINTSSLKIKTDDIITKFIPHTGHSPAYVTL